MAPGICPCSYAARLTSTSTARTSGSSRCSASQAGCANTSASAVLSASIERLSVNMVPPCINSCKTVSVGRRGESFLIPIVDGSVLRKRAYSIRKNTEVFGRTPRRWKQEDHREKVLPGDMKRGLSLLSLRDPTQLCSLGLFDKSYFDSPHRNLRTGGKGEFR